MRDDLFILITGGTIDKDHHPLTQDLYFEERSFIPQILKQCRVYDIAHEVVMLKDSTDFTESEREAILKALQARAEKRIIVTHGTDTMALSAEYLRGKFPDKTIVLTGAIRPFALLKSDAEFNLGSAIMAAQLAAPGVYVAMNGFLFEAGHVTKDRATGTFRVL